MIYLYRIKRPLHGWAEVHRASGDNRLHIVCDGQGRWYFGVVWEFWESSGGKFSEDPSGPFATRDEVEAAARHWFLGHPSGPVAELLARQPLIPSLRHLLLALNDGDPVVGDMLLDRCRQAGVAEALLSLVEEQLLDLGIWPAADEE